ncbi:MAG: hypothetical protein ACOZNI_17415 [Myxococcota bacterium]
MSGFHLTFSTRGRAPVAPGEGPRRSIVRALLRVAGARIVLFCVVDDHVHVVVLCDAREVNTLARDLLFALRAVAHAVPEAAHVRPIASRGHAEWLLTYVLTQVDHHAIDAAPALWSGSCFSELAGTRVVDGWVWNIRELLPRFRVREAFAAVGLANPLEPAPDELVRAPGAWRLAGAVAHAACADAALAGNEPHVIEARRVVAHLGRAVGIADRDLADATRTRKRQIARLAARTPCARLARAARMRLALEEVVRCASPRK